MLKRKIEVGKCYIDTTGAVWKITEYNGNNEFNGDVVIDSDQIINRDYSGSWFNEYGQYGRTNYKRYDKVDFVSEYKPIKTILPLP